MKYIKKPVEIEAVQFTGDNEIEIMNFVGRKLNVSKHPGARYEDLPNEAVNIQIPTLEGVLTANKMDYIVKGYTKELGVHFWSAKPSYFVENYEPSV